jgi:hypothetical protein
MMQVSPAASYRILVEGVLDPMWLPVLGGLEITEQLEPGHPAVTQLVGQPADESALQGVLDTLFMLGMHLVLVERLAPAP